jgi:hypothetical protein
MAGAGKEVAAHGHRREGLKAPLFLLVVRAPR